ncbi:MAG: molybdopterin-binding protein [Betaproteobacteria bacterium]
MKISARNRLQGKITKIVHGPVGAEVSIHVAPGVEIVSVITDSSARDLDLKEGMSVYALIKASSVMIGVD